MSLSRSLMLHADRGSVERGRQAGTGEVPWDCIASSCTLEFWLISTRHFHFLNNTSAVGWRLAEHLEVCVAERKEQALMTLDIKLTFMKTCAIRCYWMGCYWILLYGTDRDVPFWGLFFSFHPLLCNIFNLNWNSNERYFCPLKIMQILTDTIFTKTKNLCVFYFSLWFGYTDAVCNRV